MWSPFRIRVDDKSRVVDILLIPIPIFILNGCLVLYCYLTLGGANLCVERQSQDRA